MMRAKTNSEPDPPTRHVPELSPGLTEIILHAIARSPRDRYATVAELLLDLKDPAAVTPGSRTTKSSGSTRLSRRTVFTVVVAVVFALLFALVRASTPRTPAGAHPTYRGGAQ
jgi:hypothetical protein